MICKICGFDNKKPVGKALEDIKEGEYGYMEPNKNGWLMIYHNSKHTGIIKFPIKITGE